jgi:nitrous oxidase accessory protein NosD
MSKQLQRKTIGVFFPDSSHNQIFHNSIVNNGQQATATYGGLSPLLNYWDDGYPSGGNCWGDYTGTDLNRGHYQNETGADGIGDASYVIDANNTDHYPLMHPWES